jgi:hypothetical protein
VTSKRSAVRTGASRPGWTLAVGAAATLVVVALAGIGLTALAPRLSSPDQPAITGAVTGVVTTVNAEGTALCLHAGSSQDDLCYDFWSLRGQPVPAVSDTVTGWIVLVPRDSSEVEQLIIKPEASSAPGPGIGG